MGNPFRYSYKSEIKIKASKEAVWNTLIDLEKYTDWNPFTPKVETDWNIGHRVILTVQMKKDQKPILQKEKLKIFNPPNEVTWGMNWGMFLKAERVQRLTKISEDSTHYFTEDVIYGILVPLVNLMYGKSIQEGFDQVAISLKKYMENK